MCVQFIGSLAIVFVATGSPALIVEVGDRGFDDREANGEKTVHISSSTKVLVGPPVHVGYFRVRPFNSSATMTSWGAPVGVLEHLAYSWERAVQTFLVWPTSHDPRYAEYFFNDYYGTLVNGIVNPLIIVVIFKIYRALAGTWQQLLDEGAMVLRRTDEGALIAARARPYIGATVSYPLDINGYLFRLFNRQW